mgnify:CR=1 FL=1
MVNIINARDKKVAVIYGQLQNKTLPFYVYSIV